jgi:hypothetical protein
VLKFLREQLQKLLEQRKTLAAERDALVADIEKRGAITEAEQKAFDEKRAAIAKLDDEREQLEARIKTAEEDEKRELAAAGAYKEVGLTGPERREGGAKVGAEPHVYGKHSRSSYFLDLVRNDLNRGDGDGGVQAARQRLQRHAQELAVDLPAREARRDQAADRQIRGLEGVTDESRENAFEKRVNPNRTDGQGGYFVPPLWLIDEYIGLPRFGRVVANSVRNLDLPSGTDSINLPKVNTGAAVAAQGADAGAVNNQDLTDTFVNAPVKTLAGQQDIAMQLLDQSPISFDEIIFTDLQADYNVKMDLQVISGSGVGGNAQGILGTSSINTVTFTSGAPTAALLYPLWVQSQSTIETNRNLPATATFCTPAIWYWMASQLDSSNRPFVTALTPQAFNPMALQTGDGGEGPAGVLNSGLYVLKDGNIPSNLGAGSNETRIITLRTSDLYLWEGSMRTRTLTEVLSGTLQVRVQIYNYFAFMANRLPKAITVMSGTGLIPAAGF